ncbi:unnamed protein product [Ceutorhynchus assimilis]|uniref:Uncharacterized protein n=1 Tax=Ceutorhynchus assimilis TaxID=467358 RepID=A0A9N9MRM9_9CUCU|nr:unnamed protein product [Ceutorhynchus assimilis]
MKVLCFIVAVLGLTSAFPKSRYYPRSYMVGGSFYANPRYAREGTGYEYLPPGQMTAMVMGDTVATNSFSGSPYSPPPAHVPDIIQEDQTSDQITEKQQPFVVSEPESVNETEPEEVKADKQETLFSIEDATTEVVTVPTTKAPAKAIKKTKIGKAQKPVVVVQPEEEEEAEEDDVAPSWPFGGAAGRAGVPAYNAFFPIFIGGGTSGRSRTRSTQEEGLPGSATAIANSFSTGKGGVATSHATSFGDPYAAAMFRDAGLFNFRKTNKKQIVQFDDDEE